MATNLVDLLSRTVSPDLAGALGRAVGASESSVTSAAGALVPTLLAGLAQKASGSGGAGNLFGMLTGANVDSNIGSTIGNLLRSGETSTLGQVGSTLLNSLFGSERTASLGTELGAVSGMSGASAKNLLMMLAPLLFGTLKKFISGSNLDAGGVASLLRGQAGFLEGKLNAGLTQALGLGTPAALLSGLGHGAAAAAAPVTAAAQGVATTASSSGIGRWLPWLIGGAVALVVLSQLGRCSDRPAATPVTSAPAPAAPAAATSVTAAPAAVAGALPVKVYFASGKADIDAKGTDAIATAAAWLSGEAARKVAITGYTDRTGSAETNAELSKSRALAVRAALEAKGVAQDRIVMEKPVFVEAGTAGSDVEARRVEISAK